MSGWRNSGPVPSPWPPDRFEVRSARPAPDPGAVDRYHFAATAHEAAVRMRDVGLVTQIQVIRLSDGAVLFDLLARVHVPPEEW